MTQRLQKVQLIPEGMPFVYFRKCFAETEQHYFPVMECDGQLNGIFMSTYSRCVFFPFWNRRAGPVSKKWTSPP